jgi:transcription elongation factor GreA
MQNNIITTIEKEKLTKEILELEKKLEKKIESLSKIKKNDLSENSFYTIAVQEKQELENEINRLENILHYSRVINPDEIETSKINLSSVVKIKFIGAPFYKDKNVIKEYKIVSITDFYKTEDVISLNSSLGKVLVNKKKGDILEIKNVKQPYKIEILEIK